MTFEDRRRFIRMSLVAAGSGVLPCAATSEQAESTASLAVARQIYLVVYRRGRGWIDGKPMAEQQGLREHFLYYLDLYRQGQLQSAGGFADDSGGAAVFEADNDDAAVAFIAADPAVISGVFRYELQRWRPNPWAEISRKRAARGL